MRRYSSLKQEVCFEYFELLCGPRDTCPMPLLPRLGVYDEGYTAMAFIATKARKGSMQLAGKDYEVVLGQDYSITGRFDEPGTALTFVSKGEVSDGARWWGGDRLMAIHKLGDTFYRFSATPSGDELTVQPYTGGLGTFKVGPGRRTVAKLDARGSFRALDRAVAVGSDVADGWPKSTEHCRIPVGDYLPAYLTMTMDNLRITLSDNYHSDGKPRDSDRTRVYAFTIREDKPFVLDFSNKPAVLFASPAKGHRVKLGEKLEVAAVLTDPKLGFMIRRLNDTTPTEKKEGSGRSGSLDPTVTVTRADGEVVSQGLMPFG